MINAHIAESSSLPYFVSLRSSAKGDCAGSGLRREDRGGPEDCREDQVDWRS